MVLRHAPIPCRPLSNPCSRLPVRYPRTATPWAFEIKWDGVRAILFVEGGRVRAQSRNDLDVSAAFPELAGIGGFLGMTTCVLDGEIVALDEDGRPSFARLQHRMHVANQRGTRRRAVSDPVTFVAFDVLYLRGHSLLAETYEERRAARESLHLSGETFTTTELFRDVSGQDVLDAAVQNGLEGVVAKRRDSPYRPGRRSTDWVRSSPSGPRKWSSAAGPKATANARGAWERCFWGYPVMKGCATSARWGRDSAQATAKTSSTTSDRWRRPRAPSHLHFVAVMLLRHISCAPRSSARSRSESGPQPADSVIRPGEASARTRLRTRSWWRVRGRDPDMAALQAVTVAMSASQSRRREPPSGGESCRSPTSRRSCSPSAGSPRVSSSTTTCGSAMSCCRISRSGR